MTNEPNSSQQFGAEQASDPATYWEGKYRNTPDDRGQIWSGRANAALERETASVPPGRALDLGSGEGGDALWLAQNGWTVTAVDISPTALAHGETKARAAGVAERIRWTQADLATWHPEGTFDLVSAHFLHSPVELPREEILRRATGAVAPGGLLLIVGHAAFPPWSSHHHDGVELPTPDDVLAALELAAGQWTVVTNALVDRAATGPDGSTTTLVDSVLSVRRNRPA